MVIYLLLLIFPTPSQTSQCLIAAPLFAQVQGLAYYVASTGLVLREESTHARPASWALWAHVEAKRRAMCALYLVHWAYSVYHADAGGYHTFFDCRELSRMPGPGAKFLWAAADERAWAALYTRWLAQWMGGEDGSGGLGAGGVGGGGGQDFLFSEFMCIDPEVVMNRRAEIWLEDADELGFLMLSLGGCSL